MYLYILLFSGTLGPCSESVGACNFSGSTCQMFGAPRFARCREDPKGPECNIYICVYICIQEEHERTATIGADSPYLRNRHRWAFPRRHPVGIPPSAKPLDYSTRDADISHTFGPAEPPAGPGGPCERVKLEKITSALHQKSALETSPIICSGVLRTFGAKRH